jgi:hypothetical protein
MADVVMACIFEKIEMTDEIALHISAWIFNRIADSGLGTEMNNAIDLCARQSFSQGMMIREIDLQKMEIAMLRLNGSNAIMFQRDLIIII